LAELLDTGYSGRVTLRKGLGKIVSEDHTPAEHQLHEITVTVRYQDIVTHKFDTFMDAVAWVNADWKADISDQWVISRMNDGTFYGARLCVADRGYFVVPSED
jgi:hypothetical protein